MVRKAGMPKNNFSRTVLFAGDFVDERKAARPSRPIARPANDRNRRNPAVRVLRHHSLVRDGLQRISPHFSIASVLPVDPIHRVALEVAGDRGTNGGKKEPFADLC